MFSGARLFLPLIALAAGSWVGIGAPYEEVAQSAIGRLVASAREMGKAPSSPLPASPPQSQNADIPPVDASLLPDPTPWPQLNPTENVGRAWLLAEGPVQTPGDGRRLVTFTFDDGPFPETTPVILHVLAKHHVRGTFFWIGRYLDGNSQRAVATREVAKRLALAGHLVGNHTHDHRRLTALSHTEQVAQIDDGANSIERVIGKRPVLFRPPYGQLDAYSEDLLRTRGQTLVLWNIEAEDMKHNDPQAMFDSLRDQLEYSGGGVVLLHDIRFTSVNALDKLLAWLALHRYDPSRPREIGYEVVDLPEYLRATEKAPQPYESREQLEKARGVAWHKIHPNAGVPAVLTSEEPVM